jgi:hypothetical protein
MEEAGVKEKLGSFYFYPEQNKLVKQAVEINLSKKEKMGSTKTIVDTTGRTLFA